MRSLRDEFDLEAEPDDTIGERPVRKMSNKAVSGMAPMWRAMTDHSSRILSIGAAGAKAGMVVEALACRGAYVRGLVRHIEQRDAVLASGAREVMVGDLTEPDTLARALDGIDAVFYIAPAFIADEADLGRRFVEMARKASVRRIVFSSVIHPEVSDLANHAAKPPVEEAILNSGMEFVFLHPAMFFQNLADGWPRIVASGTIAEPWSATTRFSRVDYRDVAQVAAMALTDDRLLYGTFELAAEGLHDRHDLAALIGVAVGRKIAAARTDPEGLPPQLAPLKSMFAHYDHCGLPGNALTLRAILGREPRTLADFFRELALKGEP